MGRMERKGWSHWRGQRVTSRKDYQTKEARKEEGWPEEESFPDWKITVRLEFLQAPNKITYV